MNLQIFHDPSGRRARRTKLTLWALGLALAAAAAFLAIAVLAAERHVAPALRAADATRAKAVASKMPMDIERGAWAPANAAAEARGERIGFYVPWDEAGRRTLAAHADSLDWVAAGLARVHGRDNRWTYEPDAKLHALLDGRAKAPRLMLMVQNIGDDGQWDGRGTAGLVADAVARKRFIGQIEAALVAEKAGGVMLDLEDLPAAAHGGYRTLLTEMKARFAERGWRVDIAVPADDAAWDLAAYAPLADHLVLMAYDEHWPDGAAGPIASQPWFARVVAEAIKAAGPAKLIVGLGNYAYDWDGKGPAKPLTVEAAWKKADEAHALPTFDPATGNTHFAYVEGGVHHQVWLLDAVASWNELQVARRAGAAGVALWRLGSEDPGFWAALDTPAGQVPNLSHLPIEHQKVALDGQGEVLRLASFATAGVRKAEPAADGLIRDARYHSLPTTNVVERAGHKRRQVALTFDDGPDPRWTPAILDILKRHRATATFFVTGSNAMGEPDLLRRIVDEGSELGNHSMTHPDLDKLPEAAVRLEINATQRIVESHTGRSMRLFRAPYLGDADPDRPDELHAAKVAAEMGYLSVGLNVDPLDWAGTSADAIVRRTIEQVESGHAGKSTQIVLLHDSGGDRRATVAALPRIIKGLRARGYDLVTVSTLAGISRDAAMPPLVDGHKAAAGGASALFVGLSNGWKALGGLFLVAILLGIARSITLTALAVRAAKRAVVPNPAPHLVPSFVSVLIPAFNEERVIEASVRRILASNGPRIEVIVIDDGSKDATSAVVSRAFGFDPRVTLLCLENGGKARALNQALRIAKGDVVVALDADTQFEPDTIAKLTRWFADPAIGAVAGNAKIGNATNLVTRWQSVEYVTAQNLERCALSALDAITVVPGAVGAWRRTALDEVGGYPDDTLAEDQDLTIAIQRAGWRVACDVDAIAWTEAPDSFGALFKQRRRWAFGTLQCLWKHRAAMFEGKPHGLARYGMPQAWLFQIGFGLVSPFIDIALIASLIDTGLRVANHGFGAMQADLATMAGFWLAFAAIDLACGWIAYRLDARETRFPALRLLAMRFGYRQLLYAVVVRAVFSALAGAALRWGKLERSGEMTAIVAPGVQMDEEPLPLAA
ncbi:glycosyltransferase [Sphingomonas montanisoli]|uniref:Chitooligosaccharide deacetylase n=1 Tax=Sphingomonas montanisoli TaxID=2606412 RepID=A0A5D9C392_9SPHN|nr:glycosyltransferase [Sphingomonas montanisoli]TZG26328.1 glycosyltransferase [Sphingomonas montanisoli]